MFLDQFSFQVTFESLCYILFDTLTTRNPEQNHVLLKRQSSQNLTQQKIFSEIMTKI